MHPQLSLWRINARAQKTLTAFGGSMSENVETGLLRKVENSVGELQRQGADNQKKLDRVLRLLDGDDGQSIGLRAEMRELRRTMSDYGDHEKRLKVLEAESTSEKGYTFGRKSLIASVAAAVTFLGAILYFANQFSALGKIVGGGP